MVLKKKRLVYLFVHSPILSFLVFISGSGKTRKNTAKTLAMTSRSLGSSGQLKHRHGQLQCSANSHHGGTESRQAAWRKATNSTPRENKSRKPSLKGELGLKLGRWLETLLEEKERKGQCEQVQWPIQEDSTNSVHYIWNTGHLTWETGCPGWSASLSCVWHFRSWVDTARYGQWGAMLAGLHRTRQGGILGLWGQEQLGARWLGTTASAFLGKFRTAEYPQSFPHSTVSMQASLWQTNQL